MHGPAAIAILILSLMFCAMIAPAAIHCGGFDYPCFDRALGVND